MHAILSHSLLLVRTTLFHDEHSYCDLIDQILVAGRVELYYPPSCFSRIINESGNTVNHHWHCSNIWANAILLALYWPCNLLASNDLLVQL